MTTAFHGQRALLLGLARTNLALARYLVRQGAEVTIADEKSPDELATRVEQLDALPVRLALGGAAPDLADAADVLFVTPGWPREHAVVRRAVERGLPVTSEIELLFDLSPVPIAAITGSAGKTTTVTLVGEMLRQSGLPTQVGGNIGRPLIDRLDELAPDTRVVIELSSYQLEHLPRGPHVGAILNITPNHLDRHPSFEAYRDAKARMLDFQRPDDIGVVGLDDPVAASLLDRGAGRKMPFSLEQPLVEGACRRGRDLLLLLGDLEGVICRVDQVRLRGQHNLLNILAAATVAGLRGAELEAIGQIATTFEGVEHRIEPVRTLEGVAWFNDSKATSPSETMAALRSFDEPIVLLAGGRGKRAPLDEMAREVVSRARALVLFGEMAEELAEAMAATPGSSRVAVHRAPSLAAAVALGREAARSGDVVLLSPGGASFDAFEDYEHRGRVFKDLVRGLPERVGVG